MRILFFGTPGFAVASLRTLLKSTHSVLGVVTQPDRPAGRGLRLTPSVRSGRAAPTVRGTAKAAGLPVFQPDELTDRSFLSSVQSLNPELAVVVAYGRLLPVELLALFPHGAVNLHASLLPKLRGAAPIPWALIRGETETGVTVFQIDAQLDHGPILLQQRYPIGPEDTSQTLEVALSRLGAETLLKAIDLLERGQADPQPQEESEATTAPRLTKQDGIIDWSRDCHWIDAQVRALQPWPGAMTWLEGRILKIHRTHPEPNRHDSQAPPGTVVLADSAQGLWVQTGRGQIRIDRLQREGGKTLDSPSFLRGHPIPIGTRLTAWG